MAPQTSTKKRVNKSGSKTSRPVQRLKDKSLSATTKAIVSTDNKVQALKRQVRNQSEYRFVDQNLAFNPLNTGTFFLINNMAIGDGNGQREGSFAMMKNLRIKLNIVAGDATNIVRVMVLIFREPKGVAPVTANLLDVAGIPAVLAFRADSGNQAFTVLYDKTYSMVLTGSSGARQLSINKRLNLKTNYSLGTAGTIADIAYGGLYLFVVSDSGAAPSPAVNGAIRLRYTA